MMFRGHIRDDFQEGEKIVSAYKYRQYFVKNFKKFELKLLIYQGLSFDIFDFSNSYELYYL